MGRSLSDPLRRQASGGTGSARNRGCVLILFAGDGEAEHTLPDELRARGFDVLAVDTKLGGGDHNVLRTKVWRWVLATIRAGKYASVYMATPCCSYCVGHRPQLRSRSAPEGVNVPPEWRAYVNKHNALAAFTASVVRACEDSGTHWLLENPADRGDSLSPASWPKYRDHAPLWLMPHIAEAIHSAGASLHTFAQCYFQSPWQKYTTIAASAGLSQAAHAAFDHATCPHGNEGHSAVAFGRDREGRSRAARAAAYPRAMNISIARVIESGLSAEHKAEAGSSRTTPTTATDPAHIGGRVAEGAELSPVARAAIEATRLQPPRFASHRWSQAASSQELLAAPFPGDLYRPVIPTKPKKVRRSRGPELPPAMPTPTGNKAHTARYAERPEGPISIDMLYLPGIYDEIGEWLERCQQAAKIVLRRMAGEDVMVPHVETRVYTQEHQPLWACARVWDCSNPTDCQPVQRSTRHTVFPGAKQLHREAVREVAELLDWHDLDLIRQIGEGGIETRSECERITVLAFHHAGLFDNVSKAQEVIDTHLENEWASVGTTDLPFVPCRVLPRNVVLQPRIRVVPREDGQGWAVEEYLKPRVTTNLSHGDWRSPNAGVPGAERGVELPTGRQFGRAAAVVDEAATFGGERTANTAGYVVDAESAFSYCPIQHADLWTQAYVWWDGEGRCTFYLDRRMGFGGAFAPNRFQRVSTFVAAYVERLQRLLDEQHPPPPAVRAWTEHRRRLQERDALEGPAAQCAARFLQVYIDDFGGLGLDDIIGAAGATEQLRTELPDAVPRGIADVHIEARHTIAAGGKPAPANSRVMAYAKLTVIGLERLGLRAAPHKVLTGDPLPLLGLEFQIAKRRIACTRQKRASMLGDIDEQREWARSLRVECQRARGLVGRLGNLSQVFPEFLSVIHGGHRVAQPTWRRCGRLHRPGRIKLRRGSRAHTGFVEMLDVAREVLTSNEGIPLASRELFPGPLEEGGMLSISDASGTDGFGGYAFIADRPGEVWLVSEPWPPDMLSARRRTDEPGARRRRRDGQEEGTLSMPAAELFGKLAVTSAAARHAGTTPTHIIAVGDCEPAEMALNAGLSGNVQMNTLLKAGRAWAPQWLGVHVPREWNQDGDRLSHPALLGEVIRDAESAGLEVHVAELSDIEWSALRAAVVASRSEADGAAPSDITADADARGSRAKRRRHT